MEKKTLLPVQELSTNADMRIQRRLAYEYMKDRFWSGFYARVLKPALGFAVFGFVVYVGGMFGLDYVDNNPNMSPKSQLYSLRRGREIQALMKLQTSEEKAAYYLDLSDKRLQEVDVLLDGRTLVSFVRVAHADGDIFDAAVYTLLAESSQAFSEAQKNIQDISEIKIAQEFVKESATILIAQKDRIDRVKQNNEVPNFELEQIEAEWILAAREIQNNPLLESQILRTRLEYEIPLGEEEKIEEEFLEESETEEQAEIIDAEESMLESRVPEVSNVEVPPVVKPVVEDSFFEMRMTPEQIRKDNMDF